MELLEQIVLYTFNCFHTHVRQELLLPWSLYWLMRSGFGGYILIMPNPKPEITTGPLALDYEVQIEEEVDRIYQDTGLVPPTLIMTIMLTPFTTIAMLEEAYNCGIRHIKIYPKDVTTNSELGIADYVAIYPLLEWCEKKGDVYVHFHMEHPSHDVEGRYKEAKGLEEILQPIVIQFPRLPIVLEHVSSLAGIQFVDFWANNNRKIAATITPQHAVLTEDDVIGYSAASGYKGQMHHLWKPGLKERRDRTAIQEAILSGKPHFILGTDTAPHLSRDKYRIGANCGGFNTTVAGSVIVDLFEKAGKLDKEKIGYFTSHAGSDFFGLPRVTDTIVMEKVPWKVDDIYPVDGTNDGVVPMMAGQTFNWRIARK